MEITEYKKLIQIRVYDKPIYFKQGFIGGSMERKVLVINPEDEIAKCIRMISLKKLPTMKWCEALPVVNDGLIATASSKDFTVIWEGKIGITKYNLLDGFFNGLSKI